MLHNPSTYPNLNINLYTMKDRLDNRLMSKLMDSGWVVIASWINNPKRITLEFEHMTVSQLIIPYGFATGDETRYSDAAILNNINVEDIHISTIRMIVTNPPATRDEYGYNVSATKNEDGFVHISETRPPKSP